MEKFFKIWFWIGVAVVVPTAPLVRQSIVAILPYFSGNIFIFLYFVILLSFLAFYGILAHGLVTIISMVIASIKIRKNILGNKKYLYLLAGLLFLEIIWINIILLNGRVLMQ